MLAIQLKIGIKCAVLYLLIPARDYKYNIKHKSNMILNTLSIYFCLKKFLIDPRYVVRLYPTYSGIHFSRDT